MVVIALFVLLAGALIAAFAHRLVGLVVLIAGAVLLLYALVERDADAAALALRSSWS